MCVCIETYSQRYNKLAAKWNQANEHWAADLNPFSCTNGPLAAWLARQCIGQAAILHLSRTEIDASCWAGLARVAAMLTAMLTAKPELCQLEPLTTTTATETTILPVTQTGLEVVLVSCLLQQLAQVEGKKSTFSKLSSSSFSRRWRWPQWWHSSSFSSVLVAIFVSAVVFASR